LLHTNSRNPRRQETPLDRHSSAISPTSGTKSVPIGCDPPASAFPFLAEPPSAAERFRADEKMFKAVG